MSNTYLFQSERLGFRRWTAKDLEALALLSADQEVMEHFPKVLSRKEAEELLGRLQNHFDENGFTYYATEVLESKEWIGMIGLAYQSYPSAYTPAVDIGWRLKKDAWGKGYATEGAKRCLEYAFKELGLNQVISVCTVGNLKSENVMKKLGMIKKGEFKHPELMDYPQYETHYCYEILNPSLSL